MKLYQYLYYRLYSWNIKTWGNEDMPQWNALYGVSFMMFLNLGLIALLLQSFGIDIFSRESIPKKGIIIIALLILFINYFLFIKNKKYLSLKKKFEKENLKKRKVNTFLLWLYIILSFLFFGLGAYFIGKFYGNYH